MPDYLLVFDLDKIHEYVFATGRLKEIRGGSALMRELTEEQAILNLLNSYSPRKAYIGGGAGKVVITANNEAHAQEAADLLETHVRRESISGSLTAVVVLILNGDFKASVDKGDWLLRRRKSDKPLSLQLGMAPVTEFCQSCRTLPAVKSLVVAQPGGQPIYRDLCAACAKKWDRAQAISKSLESGKFWDEDEFGQVFIKTVPTKVQSEWRKARDCEDLSQLARLGSPSNYIGFIHCDGNRMGEHLKKLLDSVPPDKAQAGYSAFSDAINESAYEGAAEALVEVYPEPKHDPEKRGGLSYLPFDVVLVGGDDLVVITTADGAIETAAHFCEKFRQKTRQKLQENFGALGISPPVSEVAMSAGIALVHAHQPILQVQRRSKELLSSAKRFSNWKRQQQGNQGEVGAVDFLVSSSSTLDTLSGLRSTEYGFKSSVNAMQDVQHWRYRRPYTVEELQELVKWVKKVKRGYPTQKVPPMPRNKLNDIYRIFSQSDRRQIEFDLLISTVRLRGEHKKWLFEEIPTALLGATQRFWQERQNPRTNESESYAALPDLVELYEFIRTNR